MVGDARPALLALVAGGLLLYLIAATNVVGLFVARRIEREPEMALRAALGAGRGRLLRPWLLEALLLGAAGAVLGAVGAAWGVRALVALAPADLPRRAEIAVDGGALAVAAALALVPGIVAAFAAGLAGRRRTRRGSTTPGPWAAAAPACAAPSSSARWRSPARCCSVPG